MIALPAIVVPPPLKAMCYAAIEDLFTYLPQSKADPQNIALRQKLQIASWMSLWPLKLEKYAPLGLSHSLGHKLGARYSIGHGFTSVRAHSLRSMHADRALRMVVSDPRADSAPYGKHRRPRRQGEPAEGAQVHQQAAYGVPRRRRARACRCYSQVCAISMR